jgi:ABC-2 type transport system permease protein
MTAPASVPSSDAEIFDRGYRPYDGPRNGVGTGMFSVFIASVQRALGLRRKFRFKIVPVATIFIAYVPALVFMGLAVLLPAEVADELVADYAGYFGLLSIAVILFTAFVVPEVLSTDRSSGMFGMYMASPLNRVHYLVAKFGSLVSLMFLVTLFPVLFLLIGYLANDIGPDGFVNTVEVVGKIAVSGLVMSVYFALLGMAASTLTTRKGFASAGIVMLLIGSGVLSEVLVESGDASDRVLLFGLATLPFDVITRIFDEPIDQIEGVGTWASVGAWAGVCALCASIVAIGYKRLEVTK